MDAFGQQEGRGGVPEILESNHRQLGFAQHGGKTYRVGLPDYLKGVIAIHVETSAFDSHYAVAGPDLLTDEFGWNTETILPKDRIDAFPLGIRRVLDTDYSPVRLTFTRSRDFDLHSRTDVLNPRHQILMRCHGVYN
jgi:hypothetical protein